MKITMSFPNPILSPNKIKHWAQKSPIKKGYRNEGYWKGQKFGVILNPITHAVSLVFYPPNNSPRDLDNLLASMKSALDGIADGLGINDKYFRPITIDFGETDKLNPRVEINITPNTRE